MMIFLTLQKATITGEISIETETHIPDTDTNDNTEALNFHSAGLYRTQKHSWNPAVRHVMMTPTKMMTQPQPPSG